jgi:hypothetical protein
MGIMASIIEQQRADLGVLVELESSQARAFIADTHGAYALVHPIGDTRNSIFYRRAAFKLMWRSHLTVPYFNGHPWRIPIARLCSRISHRCLRVIGVHNTASTHRFPHQGKWRAQDVDLEVRYINRHPKAHIVIAGDWNELHPGIAMRTNLIRAGHIARIDAAFARQQHWSNYQRIIGPRVTRATDHQAVYTAQLRG